jgi:nitrogen fixation-related uncharacterized protein
MTGDEWIRVLMAVAIVIAAYGILALWVTRGKWDDD